MEVTTVFSTSYERSFGFTEASELFLDFCRLFHYRLLSESVADDSGDPDRAGLPPL
jgi:hypothetical protein